jgi:hypothetical protein
MKKFLAVCIALAMSVTAAAQTVDVTVSMSVPITPSGAALDQMLCSVGVQTVIEGWRMGAQANMTLMPFSPKQLTVTAHGVMGDFIIDDQAVIDFANPIQEQLTVSTKYAELDWAFTFAYSYTLLPEFAFTFGSATLGVSTRTSEGVQLASATTMTLHLLQIFSAQHGAGGVVGRIEDDGSRARRDMLFDELRAQLKVFSCVDEDRLGPDELDLLWEAHPVRDGDEHFIAGLKERRSDVVEGLLGPAGDENIFGCVVRAVVSIIFLGDGVAQLPDARLSRVFCEILGEGLFGGALDVLWRGEIGLARP